MQPLKNLIGFSILTTMLVSAVLAQAQSDDRTATYLTWQNAPNTKPLRHEGDAQVRWGYETADRALGPFEHAPFEIGDTTEFYIDDDEAYDFVLQHKSQHAYFWFERGYNVDMEALWASGKRFDKDIWALNRHIYGENDWLGVDGDERIHIVHLEGLIPGLAGYFSPDDQCSHQICIGSNERDALYLMLDYGPLNSNGYFSTLAHEFQHLIQFNIDGNEYRWIDEGLSQLAEHLNGFRDDPLTGGNLEYYLEDPNIPLNFWSIDFDSQSAYYGAGYILMVYLYERFGVSFIRALALNPLDGLASIDDILEATRQNMTVDDVIRDWWIANYVDNPYVADGRYYYQTLDLPEPVYTQSLSLSSTYRGLLNQYGVDYLEITQPGTYTLEFSGDHETPLLLAAPHSNEWMWWSYNASASATSLTRTVDLTSVDKATLKYWLTGETGRFPGYLHVLVSTDGVVWNPLQGAYMEQANRFTEAPGPHYAGLLDEWQADFIELDDYTGQIIQIRFEYITNNAITGPGFMIDDISIPEIGWSDNIESEDADWITDGFLRTQEMVEQQWTISLITHEDTPVVENIPVVAGKATVQITVPEDGAVLVVGAMAPFTKIEARYELKIN